MDKLETRSLTLSSFEVRDGTTAFGLAAPFDSDSHNLGAFVERIRPGAFTRSLREAEAGERNIFALWAHDGAAPLGSTRSKKLRLRETDKGLEFEMDTARMSPAQLSALEDGDLQMSFGFYVRQEIWTDTDDVAEREIIDLDLTEISYVINPAYPKTAAALRSLESWRTEEASRVQVTDTVEAEEVVAEVDTLELFKRCAQQQVAIRTGGK